MPTPFAAIDVETIAALNKGDESALERIFRSHFDVLVERAHERLTDEKAAAPRLVAGVVRAVWDERAAFKSSGEIEGFINEELRNRARAIRSRLAAVHRFEKTEGVKPLESHAAPTADQLWTEIATALHQPVVDPATAAKERRAHLAHEAAGHIAGVAKPRNWKVPAALAVVGAVALYFAYGSVMQSSQASLVTSLLQASNAPTVNSRPGQLGTFALADSSVVRLGADSRLIRVANFGREHRTALVTGTAAVTIGKGSTLPFEMRAGGAAVTAATGELAVRDFADEPFALVQARSDGVGVKIGKTERALKAGETVVIGRDSTLRDATADEAATAFSWLDGKLVVKEVSVRDAMKTLYRWYALDIAIRDSVVLDRMVSLEVPIDSSQAAIAGMERGAELRFEWDKERMTFRDAAKKKP